MKWVNPIKIPAQLRRYLGVGQAGDPNLDAWAQMIAALRDSTQASWNSAKKSYLTLKKIREDLDLPWMAGPGGEGNVANIGAWAPDLDQQAVDAMVMTDIAVAAANDVLQNKRKLIWNPAINDFGIEALPTDPVHIEVINGKPTLVLASGGPTHGQGTIGILPLLVAAGAVVTVVQGLVVYELIKETNATLRTITEQKTIQTLSNNQVKMIEKGATPEQAAAATKAVTDGATAIKEAEAKVEAAKGTGGPVDQWTNLIKTGGFIALGLGALYIVAQLVPKGGVRRTAPAMPLLENQRCRVGTRVQTLLFSKTHFTKSGAKRWARDHGYVAQKVDEKPNTYRVRQHDPRRFGKHSFRTIRLTDGVEAVVGCPR